MKAGASIPAAFLLSCEHAGNRVPAAARCRFAGRERLLASHRGYDRGALEAARAIADGTGAPLLYFPFTRLVADANRRETHPDCLSALFRNLPPKVLDACLAPHRRYRARLYDAVRRSPKPLCHLSVHSFTPVFRGVRRGVDIGLLFDPARPWEARLARAWKRELRRLLPGLMVRLNAPYRGTDEGVTTWLREEFGPDDYAGVELEINQRLL